MEKFSIRSMRRRSYLEVSSAHIRKSVNRQISFKDMVEIDGISKTLSRSGVRGIPERKWRELCMRMVSHVKPYLDKNQLRLLSLAEKSLKPELEMWMVRETLRRSEPRDSVRPERHLTYAILAYTDPTPLFVRSSPSRTFNNIQAFLAETVFAQDEHPEAAATALLTKDALEVMG